MNWQKFFEQHKDYTVAAGFYENRRDFSLEDLYQAFKARLCEELLVDVHGTSNYGRLVDGGDDIQHEERK